MPSRSSGHSAWAMAARTTHPLRPQPRADNPRNRGARTARTGRRYTHTRARPVPLRAHRSRSPEIHLRQDQHPQPANPAWSHHRPVGLVHRHLSTARWTNLGGRSHAPRTEDPPGHLVRAQWSSATHSAIFGRTRNRHGWRQQPGPTIVSRSGGPAASTHTPRLRCP